MYEYEVHRIANEIERELTATRLARLAKQGGFEQKPISLRSRLSGWFTRRSARPAEEIPTPPAARTRAAASQR